MKLPIRFAVVGATRGKSFIHTAQNLPEKIALTAVCDNRPAALDEWRDVEGVRIFSDYQKLLEDPDIDAVCIATPLKLHARQAIAALNAGKHVLCEVTAAWTMDECWELVRAAKASQATYMLAENYCFMRDVMMVQNMAEQGVFGEFIYAEGAYIHTVPQLLFHEDGSLTWRGELVKNDCCNHYPTHSLGPLCRWLGINKTDRLQSTATWQSASLMTRHWAERVLGEDHPLTREEWKLPNAVNTLIRTEAGVLIDHRLDTASPRPHHSARYALQGTKASFTSPIDPSQEPLIWIDGRSPADKVGVPQQWEPLYKYADEFEHPLWRADGDEAQKAGHGGGDYFVLREFADAVIKGRPPLIDVYDAVTWSCLTPLSEISIREGNAPVDIPDFTK